MLYGWFRSGSRLHYHASITLRYRFDLPGRPISYHKVSHTPSISDETPIRHDHPERQSSTDPWYTSIKQDKFINPLVSALYAIRKLHLLDGAAKSAFERAKQDVRHLQQPSDSTRTPDRNIKSILATYIRRTSTPWEDNTWSINCAVGEYNLGEAELQYLSQLGYTVEDLEAWRKFTTADSAALAMAILEAHDKPFPWSVLSFFLRRARIPLEQLRSCLPYMQKALTEHDVTTHQASVITLFARLIRHARRVAPELYPDITDILLAGLDDTKTLSATMLTQRNVILNRALSILSTPVLVRPFASTSYIEAACAKLLQYMTEHDPELQVSREGYQAVVSLQLRLPKTSQERIWAKLKAPSWPPWKQDRTAMDSKLDSEYGLSRAGQSLKRMAQAGYQAEKWDHLAKIYTGWDTDGTPTIQTRTILKPSSTKESDVWIARIEASRTLQEAWACWLNYESSTSTKQLSDSVIAAILKKIGLERHRLQHGGGPAEHILPGDGFEIYPPPLSSHQHTYTKTEPCTTREFFHYLRENGVPTGNATTAQLVNNAESIQHAYEYLKAYDELVPAHPVSALLTTDEKDQVVQKKGINEAVIRLLLQYAHGDRSRLAGRHRTLPIFDSGLAMTGHLSQHILDPKHTFVRATWLLRQDVKKRPRQWRLLFNNLARWPLKFLTLTRLRNVFYSKTGPFTQLTPSEQATFKSDVQAILCFRLTQQLISIMQNDKTWIDLEIFTIICTTTGACGRACSSILDITDSDPTKNSILQKLYKDTGFLAEAKLICQEQPHEWLFSVFNHIGGSQAVDSLMLMPLEPVAWHMWIRAVGSFGSHDGLLQVVKAMCQEGAVHTTDNTDQYEDTMRRLFTAVRVFMNRAWLQQTSSQYAELATTAYLNTAASPEMIDEARKLINNQYGDHLGAWPDDVEVELYLQRGGILQDPQ